jgi:hypothetical protein
LIHPELEEYIMPYRMPLVLIVILIIGLSTVSIAQETPSATPAPSKTPKPTATMTPENTSDASAATSQLSTELPRSFTQEDLNVLVGNVLRPNGIAYYDNFLWIVCNGDWTVYRVDAVTGETITFVEGIRNVNQMVIEETEAGFDMWLPDFDTNKLMYVNQDQAFPRTIASDNLDGPWGIATLDENRLLISNVRLDNLVIADKEGKVSVAVEGLRSPTGLLVDNDYAYVANNGSARRAIEWFRIDDLAIDDNGTIEAVEDITQPLVSGLQNASNIVLADDGYLYFTYALGNRGVVGRVNPEECRDGGCSNEQVEIVVFTELPAPLAGLTITPDMRLFVHTIYRPEIYWVQLYD